jgi:hypothetical protein
MPSAETTSQLPTTITTDPRTNPAAGERADRRGLTGGPPPDGVRCGPPELSPDRSLEILGSPFMFPEENTPLPPLAGLPRSGPARAARELRRR